MREGRVEGREERERDKHVVEGRERRGGDGRDALHVVVREDERLQVRPVRERGRELRERVAAEHPVRGEMR